MHSPRAALVLVGLGLVACGPERSAASRRAFAVLGFHDAAPRPDSAWLGTAVAELLTAELAAGDQLRAIPRENVVQAHPDVEGAAEALGPDALQALRARLGADLVVSGWYRAEAPRLTLHLVLQDARGGGSIAAFDEQGAESDLYELGARAGARLRAALGLLELSPAQLEELRASRPAGLEAARLHAEGLSLLRRFDAQAARARLEEAARADPGSALVQAALAAAWSALGHDARAKQAAQRAYELSTRLGRQDRLLVEARYHQANSHWDQAIATHRSLCEQFPDSADHALALASAQTSSGKGQDALDTLRTLRGRLSGPADPRLALEEARALLLQGDPTRALRLARQAAREAEALQARSLTAQARLVEADAQKRLGDLPGSRAACEQARALHQQTGDRGGVARALGFLAQTLWYGGDFQGAQQAAREALAISREVGDRGGEARALNTLAGLLTDQGRLSESRRAYEEALAIVSDLGDRDREAVATHNIGIALWKQGDLARAQRAFEAGLAIAREIRSARREAYALFYLGEVALDRGELDRAAERYGQARDLSDGQPSFLGDIERSLGRLAHARGDLASARAHFEKGIAMKSEKGERGFAAQARLGLGRVLLAEGRHPEAEAAARQALAAFEADRAVQLQALAEALLARALRGTGRAAEASGMAARALARTTGSEFNAARLEVVILAAPLALPPAQARERLEAARLEAERASLRGLELRARLALGLLQPGPALIRLEQDAEELGFGLLARQAREARARGGR